MTIRSLNTESIILNPFIPFLSGAETLFDNPVSFRMGGVRYGALVGLSAGTENKYSEQSDNNRLHNIEFNSKLHING